MVAQQCKESANEPTQMPFVDTLTESMGAALVKRQIVKSNRAVNLVVDSGGCIDLHCRCRILRVAAIVRRRLNFAGSASRR